jgi:hypothetical protein
MNEDRLTDGHSECPIVEGEGHWQRPRLRIEHLPRADQAARGDAIALSCDFELRHTSEASSRDLGFRNLPHHVHLGCIDHAKQDRSRRNIRTHRCGALSDHTAQR